MRDDAVLDHILGDVERIGRGRRQRWIVVAGTGGFSAAIAAWLGMRSDGEAVSAVVAMAAAMVLIASAPPRRAALRSAVVAAAFFVSLVATLYHVEFPRSWPPLASAELDCLLVGSFAGVAIAGALSLLIRLTDARPTRLRQIFVALASSLLGLAAVQFHCPSHSLAHVLAAHWTLVLTVMAVVMPAQALASRRLEKKLLGARNPSL